MEQSVHFLDQKLSSGKINLEKVQQFSLKELEKKLFPDLVTRLENISI